MDAAHDLELLVRSRHPLVVVETAEEDRLQELLQEVAGGLALGFHVWTLSEGIHLAGATGRLYDTRDPLKALDNLPTVQDHGIWWFKDLHHYLDDPRVLRKLRDLSHLRPGQRRTLVLSAPSITLPAELEKLAARYRLSPPSEDDLRRLVHGVVQDLSRRSAVRVEIDDAQYRRLIAGLKGLTRFEAERALTRAVLEDAALTGEDVEAVQRAKRELLARDGVLEYMPPDADAVPLGGLDRFKAWLRDRKGAFTAEAKRFGLTPPKGVILLGVQGCGKTMAARAVADAWSLPLLRMELGRLYDKYVGETEKNLDRALHLAEHMAPCVLLVDEIEKGLAGSDSADADAGIARRVLGRLLGWLQDRAASVFVVATCNRVGDLPPEILRKGRFDEIFFVDLPAPAERREILATHVTARGRRPEDFDLDALAQRSQGFSGAELEQAIVSGLYAAFARGGDLDTELLAAEIEGTRPLSVTRREEIDALRAWASGRAVPAG
ncbi:MAG: AAA family ATPase [Planctomycetota bacterium]